MAYPSALGNSTARQLFGGMPSLVIPLGDIRHDGPHSPVDTDARIAEKVAERLEHDGLLAHAIECGAEGEQDAPRGTGSIATASPQLALAELAPASHERASLSVSADADAGNVDAVAATGGSRPDDGRSVAPGTCSVAGGDARAGRAETALALGISMSGLAPAAELVPRLRRGNIAGHLTLVTAVNGARIEVELAYMRARRTRAWAPTCRGNLR